MGVSEAEVLELTQRWSELCDREAFNLLALERAVHEVRNRPKRISMWSDIRLNVALVTLLSCERDALCSCCSILVHFFVLVFCVRCKRRNLIYAVTAVNISASIYVRHADGCWT